MSLTKKILDKLKSGQFKMRSKTYFILKTALVILGVLAVALFVLFLFSFISFALRANGVWFLPIFGFRGLDVFLTSLPWLLIVVAVLLIVVLEMLFKRFAFAYRRPILYSILGIILVVILGTFIIDRTPLHPGLFGRAQEGRLPVFGPVYRDFGGLIRLQDAHFGVVTTTTDEGFLIKMRDEETLKVIIDAQTRLPFGRDIEKDDAVVVLGKRDDGTVKAEGVIEIKIPMPPMRPDHRQNY